MKKPIIVLLFICSLSALSQNNPAWIRTYDGIDHRDDQLYTNSLATDGQGNIYITGACFDNFNRGHFATVKYNSSGDSLWVRSYYGAAANFTDVPHALTADAEGNVYVTGQSYGTGTGYDVLTIKYNTNGDSIWVQRYNGTGNNWDGGYFISVDGSGNVYVTGNSTGNGTNQDYITL